MEIVDLSKEDKFELNSPIEQQIYADLVGGVESELKDTFILAILAENFNTIGKKEKLKKIIERFFNEVYTLQIGAMDKMYKALTEEQLKTAVPLDRYKEIFTFVLRSVKIKYETQLQLNQKIIIN